MEKIKTFIIDLENPLGVYYLGQVVRGEIILELDTPVKIRGMDRLLYCISTFTSSKMPFKILKSFLVVCFTVNFKARFFSNFGISRTVAKNSIYIYVHCSVLYQSLNSDEFLSR